MTRPILQSSKLLHAREAIAAHAVRPFERLDTVPPRQAAEIIASADRIVESGVFSIGSFNCNIRPPIDFDAHNRSFAFHMHAWDAVSALLLAYDAGGDRKYLDAGLAIARDWIARHQLPLLEMRMDEALAAARAHTATLAWYDMGVGQRIYRIAYLIDVLARLPEICTEEEFDRLWRMLAFHHELLSAESFFKGHNNHGLYQALGQLAAARRFDCLPDFQKYKTLASERLVLMMERSFFPSGAHREHSPGYHNMVLTSLLGAREAGLLSGGLNALLARAENMLGWMTAPDTTLATIGDTDLATRNYSASLAGYADESLRFLWTGGKSGSPPASGVLAVPDAGYAFARIYEDPVQLGRAAYLAQISGFHSRTHKHADHLSMVWHDRGHEILIDPGRFSYASSKPPMDSELFKQGFWYSDPRRIYVEKTRAHNCAEIDGRDYLRKAVKPSGSALLEAREEEGLVITSSETRHFRTVRHWRGLVMKAGHFLLVLDWLQDKENTHDYRQWFHLAREWEVSAGGSGMRAVNGDEELRVVSLLPGGAFQPVVCGQTEPCLLGWRSDKAESLAPSPCFSILQTANTAAFATLFVFGETAEPDLEFSQVNATFRKGRLGWRDAQGSHQLFLDRASGEFHVTRKRRLKFW